MGGIQALSVHRLDLKGLLPIVLPALAEFVLKALKLRQDLRGKHLQTCDFMKRLPYKGGHGYF